MKPIVLLGIVGFLFLNFFRRELSQMSGIRVLLSLLYLIKIVIVGLASTVKCHCRALACPVCPTGRRQKVDPTGALVLLTKNIGIQNKRFPCRCTGMTVLLSATHEFASQTSQILNDCVAFSNIQTCLVLHFFRGIF